MTIYEQLIKACSRTEGRLLTASAIKQSLVDQFVTNPASILPSDYCYNRWKHAVPKPKPLFVRVGSGEYRYVAPNNPYTGLVFWRPKSATEDKVAGERVNGELRLYDTEVLESRPVSEELAPKGLPQLDESATVPLSAESTSSSG